MKPSDSHRNFSNHLTMLFLCSQVFSADSFDNLYLKVVQDSLKTSSFRTVHLIPLVPDIVPSLIVVANKVMLTPPDGLLDIGRSKEKIAELRTELAAYTTHPSGCFGDRLGITYMPKKDALESVGRADLVSAVRSCGGFVVVAGALGWMTHRKPEGESIYYKCDLCLCETLITEQYCEYFVPFWPELFAYKH